MISAWRGPTAPEPSGRARRRRESATHSPGSVATSTIIPYASDTATPWLGANPTHAQTLAAVPSRSPQPATESGISIESSSGGASASSTLADSSTPIARAAHSITTA